MKAFIFAAGKGTRLQPFTNQHPKALAKVNNKTLLERNILYLKSFGINDFIINIHHFGEQILDFLKEIKILGLRLKSRTKEKNFWRQAVLYSSPKI